MWAKVFVYKALNNMQICLFFFYSFRSNLGLESLDQIAEPPTPPHHPLINSGQKSCQLMKQEGKPNDNCLRTRSQQHMAYHQSGKYKNYLYDILFLCSLEQRKTKLICTQAALARKQQKSMTLLGA